LLTNKVFYEKYLRGFKDDLPEIFKVSQVLIQIKEGLTEDVEFNVQKAEGAKCPRCWNWRLSVGKDKEHPDICDICLRQIG